MLFLLYIYEYIAKMLLAMMDQMVFWQTHFVADSYIIFNLFKQFTEVQMKNLAFVPVFATTRK